MIVHRALVALLVLGTAAALSRDTIADDEPAPFVLADFNDAKSLKSVKAGTGSAEFVKDDSGAGGNALRWVVDPAAANVAPYVHIRVPPALDLVKYRYVQFRIRRDGGRAGPMYFRIENDPTRLLGTRVRGVTTEWQTMWYDLDTFEGTGLFDPATVKMVAFVINGSSGGSYQIDDVVLLAKPPATAGAPADETSPARRTVANFEAEESIEYVDPLLAKAERVPAGASDKGFVLAFTGDPGAKTPQAEVFGVPGDMRPYGRLRFRVRASKAVKQPLHVRLETTVDDYVGAKVTGVSTQWKTIELKIPEMLEFQDFDPRHVKAVAFIFFEVLDAVVQIDDVEVEATPGGWRSDAELVAKVFGDARAKKVLKETTEHFDVYSDAAVVQGKFPPALEEHYAFVTKALGLREMDERLPVFIHQNPSLYVEFCVRYLGMTKAAAEVSAGRGGAGYFATYYQAPDAQTVVHELTHSLFQRSCGVWGGSWFHEGVAVYVEHLYRHESAAELFAENLRSGQFVHLTDLMTMPRLAAGKDVKGGAGTPARLYLEAGAFHEFLRRGPMAAQAQALFAAICRARDGKPEDAPARVAALLGRSIDDIEKDWVAWGSHPPKDE